MGRASERTADRGGHHIRQQAEGLVALRQGARMAGVGGLPDNQGHRLPRLAPANGCVPAKMTLPVSSQSLPFSGTGRRTAPCVRAGNAELKPQSLVALLAGSRVAGRGGCAHVERQRMSLLRGEESADRLQRPRDPQTAAVKTVAPETERKPDARNGHPRLPPQGLVAMPGWPRMEGRHLLPLRPSKKRLPHLRGAGQQAVAGKTGL